MKRFFIFVIMIWVFVFIKCKQPPADNNLTISNEINNKPSNNNSNNNSSSNNYSNTSSDNKELEDHKDDEDEDDDKSDDEKNDDKKDNNENHIVDDCGYDDGTYLAVVDYDNPETNFTSIYNLEVIVRGCNVIEIDFPKGGYLDEDHINPTEINEDGNAAIEDDRGRSFKVHLSESDKRVGN